MKCGIKFTIQHIYGSLLYDILKGVIDKNSFWIVSNDQVFLIEPTKKFPGIFNGSIISGDEFERIICDNVYYIVFLNAYAYTSELDALNIANLEQYFTIETFEEFSKSNCIIALYIYDSINVEVAAKDESIISIIQSNAEKAGFTDIKIITENETSILRLGE